MNTMGLTRVDQNGARQRTGAAGKFRHDHGAGQTTVVAADQVFKGHGVHAFLDRRDQDAIGGFVQGQEIVGFQFLVQTINGAAGAGDVGKACIGPPHHLIDPSAQLPPPSLDRATQTPRMAVRGPLLLHGAGIDRQHDLHQHDKFRQFGIPQQKFFKRH
jgi:hypothetical protein